MPRRKAEPSNGSNAAPLLREDVYGRLKEAVLSCALQPGSKIYEQELALYYKVSKSPIRDALVRLQAEGLVEVLPRKGYRVAPISVADAIELYEMRLILERACVERACRFASDADIESLERFRRGPTRNERTVWLDYNRAFHMAIASICGSRRLARATIDVIRIFDRLTCVSVSRFEGGQALQRFVREHCALIDAIKRRDSRRASALVRSHIESSRKRMLEAISSLAIVP
ncbi:MAG TPA: GntR family transcriptional regulator [Alphaproteobacteria bacterium]